MSKGPRFQTSHRGRALPRKRGELGEEPAARREKEPVPPPTNLPRPRSGPYSPSGGMGAASHVCDFFSSRNRTGARIHQPIVFKAQLKYIGWFGCGYAALRRTSEPGVRIVYPANPIVPFAPLRISRIGYSRCTKYLSHANECSSC